MKTLGDAKEFIKALELKPNTKYLFIANSAVFSQEHVVRLLGDLKNEGIDAIEAIMARGDVNQLKLLELPKK